jgi:hypothetical protein
VAGIADFEMFTIILSRPGWLIYLSKLNLFSKNLPYLIKNNFGFLKHKPVLKSEHSESLCFKINHPGQTIYISARQMISLSGHPSLKKGGETFVPKTPLVDG